MSSQHQRRFQALETWEADLCRREAGLVADRAEFERRIETFVDTRATEIAEAMELVSKVFPRGIIFPATRAGSGGRVH